MVLLGLATRTLWLLAIRPTSGASKNVTIGSNHDCRRLTGDLGHVDATDDSARLTQQQSNWNTGVVQRHGIHELGAPSCAASAREN